MPTKIILIADKVLAVVVYVGWGGGGARDRWGVVCLFCFFLFFLPRKINNVNYSDQISHMIACTVVIIHKRLQLNDYHLFNICSKF